MRCKYSRVVTFVCKEARSQNVFDGNDGNIWLRDHVGRERVLYRKTVLILIRRALPALATDMDILLYRALTGAAAQDKPSVAKLPCIGNEVSPGSVSPAPISLVSIRIMCSRIRSGLRTRFGI